MKKVWMTLVLLGAMASESILAISPPVGPANAWEWGAFAEIDLGILIFFQGIGINVGPSYGPLRLSAGFQSFNSKIPALSGAPDGFKIQVKSIWSINADVFPVSWDFGAPYLRLSYHYKTQRITHVSDDTVVELSSHLLGPEVGFLLRPIRQIYFAPRTGLLYYLVSPQPNQAPVQIGSGQYDNPKHKVWDFFYSLSFGGAL